MKKTLTENISRYDDKMRLRMDMKTARAALFALLPALAVGWLVGRISILVGFPVGLVCFSALFLLQVSKLDGVPMMSYLRLIFGGSKTLPYVFRPEQLRLQLQEKEDAPHGKKQKKKRG